MIKNVSILVVGVLVCWQGTSQAATRSWCTSAVGPLVANVCDGFSQGGRQMCENHGCMWAEEELTPFQAKDIPIAADSAEVRLSDDGCSNLSVDPNLVTRHGPITGIDQSATSGIAMSNAVSKCETVRALEAKNGNGEAKNGVCEVRVLTEFDHGPKGIGYQASAGIKYMKLLSDAELRQARCQKLRHCQVQAISDDKKTADFLTKLEQVLQSQKCP